MLQRLTTGLLVLTLALAGCEDGTGPDTRTGQVTVQFATATSATAAAPAASTALLNRAEPLVLEGSNGVLTITEIHLIVSEFELEAEEGACEVDLDDGFDDDEDCPDFEADPSLVDLPLGTGTVEVATDAVPVGTYTGFEFEVEDIDLDEEDEDETELANLAAAVRAAFPDWPEEASMLVIGTFDPDPTAADDERPFRVFFDAEIEVELDFATPLVVTEGGATQAITVGIMPELWFGRPDGTVRDLSALDFGATGAPVDFELELEDGFDLEIDDAD